MSSNCFNTTKNRKEFENINGQTYKQTIKGEKRQTKIYITLEKKLKI